MNLMMDPREDVIVDKDTMPTAKFENALRAENDLSGIV